MADLTVLILTRNEELHIERALSRVLTTGLASRVVVVDSGSTDRTVELARDAGAEVLHHPFVNYAKQFAWGLANAEINTQWVMRLDADEVIPPALQSELDTELRSAGPDVGGFAMNRRHIFLGRWIRFGGRYPLTLTRVWRNGLGEIEDRWMDEHMIVRSGRVVNLRNFFDDHNLNDLTFFTEKHNGYATREAIDVLLRRQAITGPADLESHSSGLQAAVKRVIKERIYNKLPFAVGAAGYFLWRYIFQLGFLDGNAGLTYHVLQGFWYRFLVGAKVKELENELRKAKSASEWSAILSARTGMRVDQDFD